LIRAVKLCVSNFFSAALSSVSRIAKNLACSLDNDFLTSYSQLLSHEVMLVTFGMVLKRSKDAISEFLVKGSRLKTEGVKECIRAAALHRVKFRTLHQFLAEAMPSRRRGHGKRCDF